MARFHKGSLVVFNPKEKEYKNEPEHFTSVGVILKRKKGEPGYSVQCLFDYSGDSDKIYHIPDERYIRFLAPPKKTPRSDWNLQQIILCLVFEREKLAQTMREINDALTSNNLI